VNQDIARLLGDLYSNPLFKQGFLDFIVKLQHDGIDGARKFWEGYPSKDKLFEGAPHLFEQMLSFYSSIGFVPAKKHEEVVKERDELKRENEFLKETIKELQLKVFTEGSAKMQETWAGILEKQMEMNKELAKDFLKLFGQKGDT
jgi:regulator of replication initiation timing